MERVHSGMSGDDDTLPSLFELLRKRRSIRAFKKKQIKSKDVIKTILQACDMAPSSGGLQTYEVYYIKSHDKRRKLVSAAHNQEYVSESALLMIFCANASRSVTMFG